MKSQRLTFTSTLTPDKPSQEQLFARLCAGVGVSIFGSVCPWIYVCDPALQRNDSGRLIIIGLHQSRKGKDESDWDDGSWAELLMAAALAGLPSVSGFLPWSAVCLLECLLFWMHSIEDTNCIIHGRQPGNGKDEWWPLFLSWQRRSREEPYTITHNFKFDQRIATGEVLTTRTRPEGTESWERRAHSLTFQRDEVQLC